MKVTGTCIQGCASATKLLEHLVCVVTNGQITPTISIVNGATLNIIGNSDIKRKPVSQLYLFIEQGDILGRGHSKSL